MGRVADVPDHGSRILMGRRGRSAAGFRRTRGRMGRLGRRLGGEGLCLADCFGFCCLVRRGG